MLVQLGLFVISEEIQKFEHGYLPFVVVFQRYMLEKGIACGKTALMVFQNQFTWFYVR